MLILTQIWRDYMGEYVTVSIPKALIEKIDVIRKTHGYTSRPDFIKQAVRNELQRLDHGEN